LALARPVDPALESFHGQGIAVDFFAPQIGVAGVQVKLNFEG